MARKKTRWAGGFLLLAAGLCLGLFFVFAWGWLSVVGLSAAPLTLSFAGGLSESGSVTNAFSQKAIITLAAGGIIAVLAGFAWRKRWSGAGIVVFSLVVLGVVVWWLGWGAGWQWLGAA